MTNLVAYYLVAMPLAILFAFKFKFYTKVRKHYFTVHHHLQQSAYDYMIIIAMTFFAGVVGWPDLRSGMPGLLAAGDHRPHQVVKDRGLHEGGQGQLHRLVYVKKKNTLLRRGK